MRNDSSIHLTRGLTITVRTPKGETIVQLSRLSAQIFAATLRAYSGLPSKGVDLHAGTFHTVHAEAVLAPAKTPPVVRLGPAGRGGVRSR